MGLSILLALFICICIWDADRNTATSPATTTVLMRTKTVGLYHICAIPCNPYWFSLALLALVCAVGFFRTAPKLCGIGNIKNTSYP